METQVAKTLKGFCSGNIQRQTRPFWAKVGSWQTRLSPTFREPFADFSPTNMILKTYVSWEDGWVFQFQYHLKPIPIWEKLPKFLFNGCMNATRTAKHEYLYHIHLV